MSVAVASNRPPFREALSFWWKLGWISFGGTAAHIGIMHEELVERKRWISNAAFLHALSHCMILPGPEAQQLAIYIGTRLHGKRGGLVAGTLFVLPSMFVLLALSIIYVKFGNLPSLVAGFAGLKPAVLGLVLLALYQSFCQGVASCPAVGDCRSRVCRDVLLQCYRCQSSWARS